MLIKINKQPIEVTAEDDEREGFPVIGLCVSAAAFTSILSLLDYIGAIFVGYHPLPFMQVVTKFILHIIGG